MRGLAAALVLTMALPVTAFGAETVQVDGYDRMEGEAAEYQLSISNVTGKTTVAGKEAYVCQAPVKVSAVDELQTFEVTKYLSAGNALAAQGVMLPDGYTQESWDALYFDSEGEAVVKLAPLIPSKNLASIVPLVCILPLQAARKYIWWWKAMDKQRQA